MNNKKYGYTLNFEKDFTGSESDSDISVLKYKRQTEKQKISNGPSFVDETKKILNDNDFVYYKEENVAVENGNLVLIADKKDNVFSGAAVKLNGKTFSKGYIEIVADMPVAAGIWPKISLKGKNGIIDVTVNFAQIMGIKGKNECSMETEYTENGKTLKQSYLYSNNNTWPTCYPPLNSNEILSKGKHTYGFKLSEEFAVFYIDDKEFCKVNTDIPIFDVFKCEYELMITLSVADSETEAPDESTNLPVKMLIENIKFYQ